MSTATGDRLPDGLRKAAILIASLDTAEADRLLEQMEPHRAEKVRNAVLALGTVSPAEQQQVLEEFFRIGALMPKEENTGIELGGRLAQQLAARARQPQRNSSAGEEPLFQFLQDAEADKLVRILMPERPQTIALVLAHLPPQQAAAALARLPAHQQVEVIRRLVELEETDAEILREVERGLQERFSQQVHMQRRRVAGLAAVAAILRAADRRIAVQILDNLAAHDMPLAQRLSPPPLEFDDLAALDSATLATVLRAAGEQLVALALMGLDPQLTERLLSCLPSATSQRLRQQLEQPGPLLLSDVEGAKQQIAELARRLAIEGRIRLPTTEYPAVAA